MSRTQPDDFEGLPLSEARRVDAVCRRFEADWRAGGDPRIEDRLGEVAEPLRRALLRELLALELDLRRGRGEAPAPSEYERRFPNYPEQIDAAFREAAGETPPPGEPHADDPDRTPLIDPDRTPLIYSVAGKDGKVIPLLDAEGRILLRGTFRPGQVLQGRYILERELGHGGMGVVYLGRDLHLHPAVAIKGMLLAGRRGQADAAMAARLREAFEGEARLAAELHHPHIATIFDYGFHEGEPFMVFEYLPGETLRELLRRRGRLSLDEVRLIIGPLAQALDFAHARGVIHRDLKPENIKSTEQAQFKILDLGLAKRFRDVLDWRGFAGTPAYASPEQAAGLPCDGRTDQYALALIAFELLTGRRVFEANDCSRLLDLHRNQPPPWPQEIQPDLPNSACEAMVQALHKDPNHRHASCEELAVAMGCQLLSAPAPMPELLRETSCKKMAGRWTSRHIGVFRVPLIYLALAPDALWISFRGEMIRLPLGAVAELSRRRGSRALHLRLTPRSGKTKQRFLFRSRRDCRQWFDLLRDLHKALPPHASRELEETRVEPVVLLHQRPRTRFQILGNVEAMAKRPGGALAGLQVRGAMMGANAVADLQEERIARFFNTEHRASGMAIRAVDREGEGELKARWFASQASQIATWMVTLVFFSAIPAFGILVFVVITSLALARVPAPDRPENAWIMVILPLLNFLASLLPLTIVLPFRVLKWPQLARPAAVLFYGMSASNVIYIGGGMINAIASRDALTIGIGLVAHLVFWSLMTIFPLFQIYIATRSWRAYSEYRKMVQGVAMEASPLRRFSGVIALIGAVVYAGALLGYAVLEQLDKYPRAARRDVPSLNRPNGGMTTPGLRRGMGR